MIKTIYRTLWVAVAVALCAGPLLAAGPNDLPGADIPVTQRVSVDYHYVDLGKSFTYETGFGRVDVKASGHATGLRARVTPTLELGFKYFDFDVDSYFLGSQVGVSSASAGLYSIKKRFSINGEAADMDYGYLDNASITGIHLLSLARTRTAYGVDWTGGLTAWSGGAADERAGVFASAVWRPAPELALFVQYNSTDFLKAFQNYVIAPSASNIGTINTATAPKDALSMGVTGRILDTVNVTFAVYDLDVQMKPVLGISYSR
jgi:hypothetical protein